MRAREFISENESKAVTINIPITITIPNGGGMPTVAAPAGDELPPDPTFVSPLQQELELKKQQGGKQSAIINQIVSDDGAFSEEPQEETEVGAPETVQAVPENQPKKQLFNLRK